MPDNPQPPIGYVIGGGLKESFRVRLSVDPLTVQEGAFVVIARTLPEMDLRKVTA
jgi:hypothetical protein